MINEADFNKLTKAQKRIAICKDVLARHQQLNEQKLQ